MSKHRMERKPIAFSLLMRYWRYRLGVWLVNMQRKRIK
jgi:hypothetical protein